MSTLPPTLPGGQVVRAGRGRRGYHRPSGVERVTGTSAGTRQGGIGGREAPELPPAAWCSTGNPPGITAGAGSAAPFTPAKSRLVL
jgi:hypothetical protein